MQALFDKLMNQIHLPEAIRQDENFQNADIVKVEVHKVSQVWHFYLLFNQVLAPMHYQALSSGLAQAFEGIASTQLTIQVRQNTPSLDQIRSYYPLALELVNSKSFTTVLKRYQIEPKASDFVVRVGLGEHLFQKIQGQWPRFVQAYARLGFEDLKLFLETDEALVTAALADQKAHEAQLEAQFNEHQAQLASMQQLRSEEKSISKDAVIFGIGRDISPKQPVSQMQDVTMEENGLIFQGYVFAAEHKVFKNRTTGKESHQLELKMTDYTSSFIIQKWGRTKDDFEQFDMAKKGMWLKVKGNIQMDTFKHELVMQAQDIQEIPTQNVRRDLVADGDKRVEFHAHTNMSTMDAISDVSDLVAQAAQFGHKAIAVVDHSGAQSYPKAYSAGKKHGVKIIYGVEVNLVDDKVPIAYNEAAYDLNEATYVVFDVETTGLSAVYNKLIQVAASKMYKGNVIEEFDEFIDPGHPLSEFTTQLTGITDAHVKGAKPLEEVLRAFKQFCEGSILVAHNATFDVGFMNINYERHGLSPIEQPVIDTLELSRNLYPEFKRHGLGALTKRFNVALEHHHMANYDAEATGRLLFVFLEELKSKHGVTELLDLNHKIVDKDSYKQARVRHATVYATTQEGLKNLFKLISLANITYYHGVPRLPKSVLDAHRIGLLIGSACDEGEVFDALVTSTFDHALEVAKYYDFIEIMPPAFYQPLIVKETLRDELELQSILKDLIKLGESLDKPVLATGNVHYLNPEDAIYREIIVRSLGSGAIINRPIGKGENANPAPLPQVHFRTTSEMLDAFKFLGEDKAKEVVVTNTQAMSQRFEDLTPVREDLYTPYIEGSEETVAQLTYERAFELYGTPLPDIVDLRIEKELKSIIGNGFSVIYLTSQMLVKRSNDRGYLVGSRGSVGSSFVATMIGITEVNPLSPHYVCLSCQYSEFYTEGQYGSGFDMPDKACPNCGERLHKDGHDIPFETFLGFKGDKVPDIDLNFSGEDQPDAHLDVRDIFGADYAFRAGTIGTVAEKTAFGFVKGYERDYGKYYRGAEIERLAQGATGVKRTTGQHPGGIIVIPNYMDVYDFTPIQYPADDIHAEWQTTHFDFHAIHDNVLKLDILGHVDPTMIRMLEKLSGIDPKTIPLDDPEMMQIFSGTEVLGVTPEQIFSKTGTLGVPEMGTNFVRGMLEETRPNTFAELLQVSGLSHGTDVWLGNAQDLIKAGIADLKTVIGCRDDIMVYLIHRGLDESMAFNIMERVRKGMWLKISEDEREGYIAAMRENNVPEWYIESCGKIKYMFPKAHAAAYVMMALRVAWFKVHHPIYYYCAWMSLRADAYDLKTMSAGLDTVKSRLEEIKAKGNDASNTERALYDTLLLCNEMLERGFEFAKLDLYNSEALTFKIEGNTLIPPFVVMDGLGENVAKQIVAARQDGEFLSKTELRKRAGVSQTLVDAMDEMGILGAMPEDNQLSLFDELF